MKPRTISTFYQVQGIWTGSINKVWQDYASAFAKTHKGGLKQLRRMKREYPIYHKFRLVESITRVIA
jgi:hypothetical protein